MKRCILLAVLFSCLLLACGGITSTSSPSTYSSGRSVEISSSAGVALGLVDVSLDDEGTPTLSFSLPFPQVPTFLGDIGPHAEVSISFPKKKTLAIITEDNQWVYDLHGEKFKVDLQGVNATVMSDGQGNLVVYVQDMAATSHKPIMRTVDTQSEIQSLIERWDKIHHQADRYWDTSQLDSVLSDAALTQQLQTASWLKNNNCYWIVMENKKPVISRFEVVNSDYVVYWVDKDWDMDLYCDGSKNKDDDGPFTMKYDMRKIGTQWYITKKVVD